MFRAGSMKIAATALAAIAAVAIGSGSARAQDSVQAPQPVGYENDVHCFGYVAPDDRSFLGAVVSGDAVYEQSAFSTGDIVYVDEAGGVQAGDEYWFVSPMQEVEDPVKGGEIGRFFQYLGYGKALCVKEGTAILQIEFACTDVPLGVFIEPFEPIPVPLARSGAPLTGCDPPNGKPVGTIVYSRDDVLMLGIGSDVVLNIGEDAELSPGDFLTVFRYARPPDFDIAANGELVAQRKALVIPRTVLGEAAILTVRDNTSTARIVSMSHAMQLGDQVEVK